MDEIILIDKEKGYTSRDVVNIVSKALNTKKVGHFGTLDPMAEGLLIIGVGNYTKLGNFFENDSKEYIAEVLVGRSTDTYDIEGNTISENYTSIDKDTLEKTLSTFKGTYFQEVPIYSATKVNGKRLYEYAREGVSVSLPKKEVTIFDINLISLFERDNYQYFSFSCTVSKGTYIRSLINDISKKINIPLCMSKLVRTKQDKFSLDDANTLEDIKSGNYKSLNIRDVIDVDVEEIPLELENRILNGNKIERSKSKYLLFTKNGEDVVLYGNSFAEMKPVLTLKNN
ncbi:MAG: tRNA pseudouridine(55) synthase TruB [Bacilli bacterium]|nr:tRNA pseudouridine(55) synthase TruB [Bacilli bacterium]